MKQLCRVDPYNKGAFTPNITSFATKISSFFKIHGTSPSLKEWSTYPLFSFWGQCFFLVLKEIRSLLIANVSLCFIICASINKMKHFLICAWDIINGTILIWSQYEKFWFLHLWMVFDDVNMINCFFWWLEIWSSMCFINDFPSMVGY